MYKIIGGDGNEYGPVSAEQLHQWIAEGRANNQTRVQREGETEWKPLAAFLEFADTLASQARAQSEAAATTPPPFSSGTVAGGASPLAEGDYQLDLGGCISQGWELMKKNFGTLFGGFIVYILIAGGIGALGAIPLVGALVQVASLVVTGPLMGGLFYLFLRVVRGEPGEVGDVFAGFRKQFGQLFLGYIVTALLGGLCFIPVVVAGFLSVFPALLHHEPPDPAQLIMVGAVFLVCLIPAVYLQTNWMFTLPLIIDRELDFWIAMKTSWRRVGLHWWQVFGLLVLTGLLNLGGLLLCCVGILVTIPTGFVALMLAYETIFSGKTTGNN